MDAVQKANAGHPGTAMALAPVAYLIYRELLRANPTEPRLAGPRPLRALGGPCLHPPVRDPPSHGLQPLARGARAVPPVGVAHPRPSGALPDAGSRDHHRAARPGIRERRRHGDGRALPGAALQPAGPRGRRPPRVRDRLGRRSHGGRRLRRPPRSPARSGSASSSSSTTTTASRSTARPRSPSTTRTRASASRPTAGTSSTSPTSTTSTRSRAALATPRREAERPSLIVVRSHIAYPAPARAGHGQGARLAARRGRGARDEGGCSASIPTRTSSCPDGVYEHMSLVREGPGARGRVARALRGLARRVPRRCGGLGPAPGPGSPCPAGWRRCRASIRPRSRSSPPALPARRSWRPFKRVHADDGRRRGRPRRVDPDRLRRRRGLLATFAGRNIPFGVREHAMGAIVNGLALHGGIVKPYGSTFLIFSDYMRPAVRLSALMSLPVVWVWTHDSVGLGEDGPTHQPVEHYAALRAIPNLWVMRPADANETTIAWKVALEREDGPVALILSRQDLPVLERGEVAAPTQPASSAAPTCSGSRTAAPLRTSSCSRPAPRCPSRSRRRRLLAEDGLAVRVVSMPCWELFEAQPAEYRDEVLPPDCRRPRRGRGGRLHGLGALDRQRGATSSRSSASAPRLRALPSSRSSASRPANVAMRARALLQRRQRVG